MRQLFRLVEEVEACRQRFAVCRPSTTSSSLSSSENRRSGKRQLFARRQQAEERSDADFDLFLFASSANRPSSLPDVDRLVFSHCNLSDFSYNYSSNQIFIQLEIAAITMANANELQEHHDMFSIDDNNINGGLLF